MNKTEMFEIYDQFLKKSDEKVNSNTNPKVEDEVTLDFPIKALQLEPDELEAMIVGGDRISKELATIAHKLYETQIDLRNKRDMFFTILEENYE